MSPAKDNRPAEDSGFADLKTLFINCSLKRDSAKSHTLTLINKAASIMRAQGVQIEIIHALDYQIAFGMDKDMTKAGWDQDDWPKVMDKILGSDILVIGSPIWLGVKSSVATLVIERMYAYSGETNQKDQYIFYGRIGGCLITGNEDGIKACSRDILYSLQHIGFTIPPQADAGWVGEAGPGPSYGDKLKGSDVPVGFDNDFTNRNTQFLAWNLMHIAKMLKASGGIPAQGNLVSEWE